MEITDAKAALLSNYEVYQVLMERKLAGQRRSDNVRPPDNLSTIVYETLKFLESTPTVAQSPAVVGDFLKAVAPFQLTKAEKLQILNLRPTTPVEIQLIVEECEERLSEEKVQELIEIITRILPMKSSDNTVPPPTAGEEMDGTDT